MNWALIFRLSLFGLAMSIATVFVIPSNIEPAFWLALTGPVIGALSGVVLGLFALVFAKFAGGRQTPTR